MPSSSDSGQAQNLFTKLPEEIWLHIFSFLDIKSQVFMARVSKTAHRLIHDPEIIRNNLKRYFGVDLPGQSAIKPSLLWNTLEHYHIEHFASAEPILPCFGEISQLWSAIKEDNLAIFQAALVDKKRCLRSRDKEGNSLLHKAAEAGYKTIAEFLIKEKPFLLTHVNNASQSASDVARKAGHITLADTLQQKRKERQNLYRKLYFALLSGENQAVITLWDQHQDLLLLIDAQENTLLHYLSHQGNSYLIDELNLHLKALELSLVRISNCIGLYPADLAFLAGHSALADILALSSNGYQNEAIARAAAIMGRKDILEIIPFSQKEILEYALSNGQLPIVQWLLQDKTPSDISHALKSNPNNLRYNLWQKAILSGNIELVEFLSNQCPGPQTFRADDMWFNYDIEAAAKSGNPHMLEYLINSWPYSIDSLEVALPDLVKLNAIDTVRLLLAKMGEEKIKIYTFREAIEYAFKGTIKREIIYYLLNYVQTCYVKKTISENFLRSVYTEFLSHAIKAYDKEFIALLLRLGGEIKFKKDDLANLDKLSPELKSLLEKAIAKQRRQKFLHIFTPTTKYLISLSILVGIGFLFISLIVVYPAYTTVLLIAAILSSIILSSFAFYFTYQFIVAFCTLSSFLSIKPNLDELKVIIEKNDNIAKEQMAYRDMLYQVTFQGQHLPEPVTEEMVAKQFASPLQTTKPNRNSQQEVVVNIQEPQDVCVLQS